MYIYRDREREIDRGKTTTTSTTVFLVPGGGGENKKVPAISVDTLRDGRKGDLQNYCCGGKVIYIYIYIYSLWRDFFARE